MPWRYDSLGRLATATLPGSATPVVFTPYPNDTLSVASPGAGQLLHLDYGVNAVRNPPPTTRTIA